MPSPSAAPSRGLPQHIARRAAASLAPGLLLAVLAVMMLDQSARWLLTSMTRGGFVPDEFEIAHFSDQPGTGGFGYGGQIVSTGETVSSDGTIIVSLDRIRELEAARAIPGARVPVRYLPRQAPWTAVDYVVPFRVQAPDEFETNAFGWAVINALFAAGAVWLIRRAVRIAKGKMA